MVAEWSVTNKEMTVWGDSVKRTGKVEMRHWA